MTNQYYSINSNYLNAFNRIWISVIDFTETKTEFNEKKKRNRINACIAHTINILLLFNYSRYLHNIQIKLLKEKIHEKFVLVFFWIIIVRISSHLFHKQFVFLFFYFFTQFRCFNFTFLQFNESTNLILICFPSILYRNSAIKNENYYFFSSKVIANKFSIFMNSNLRFVLGSTFCSYNFH